MLFGLLIWVWIISRSSKYKKLKQWKTFVYKKNYTSITFISFNPGLALLASKQLGPYYNNVA